MTISSTNRKAGPYVGNDVAVAFPFAFKVFAASDLYVVRADTTGAETTLTLTTDYTVLLNADQNANPGGAITLSAVLASGYSLVISSKLDYLQPTDLTNQGGFYPKVITNALDRLTIFIQQLSESVSRSLKTAISTPAGVSTQLPVPVKDTLIGWNSAGTGFENIPRTEAALAGFVQAGSDATTRAAQDKLREFISPLDFGAVGDGVVDDSTADAKAIAQAQAIGGATVVYPGKLKTGGAVQRGGQRWIDQGFPTSFKRQQRWAYRADLVAANGEGTNAFQAISINGTPIQNTYNNFLATATPDVVTMSGWALRGAGGTNPLVVSNFGAWFENNTQIVWAQEIDVNNEGATMAEGDHKGGVGVAINTGSTYSPNSGIDIRRYTGAGSGPGFLQGIVIAGARNCGVRIEAMDSASYPSMSPAAPGTIQAIQVLRSSDSHFRWVLNQDGGMSWGPGNADSDVTLTRTGAGILQVGGAIQDTVAWATSNPTPVPASGAFNTATATVRWNQIGKRVFFAAKVTITTNGTGAGSVQVPLPVAANTAMSQIAAGRADSVSGKLLQGKISGSTLYIYNYDNTYPGANGETLNVTGIYEAA